jgi:hypothetical protein
MPLFATLFWWLAALAFVILIVQLFWRGLYAALPAMGFFFLAALVPVWGTTLFSLGATCG